MEIKNKLNSFYNFLFAVFCFSIPFEEYASAAPNLLIVALLALFPFVVKKNQIRTVLQNKSYIAFLFFFLFILINTLIKQQISADFYVLSKLIIPCLLILLSAPLERIKKIKFSFIIATLLSVLYSTINLIEYNIASEVFNFSKGNFINDLLVSERLYIGLCSVVSFVFLIELFVKSKTNTKKIIYFTASIFLVSFVFLIAARIAIITIVLISFMFILSKLGRKNKIISSISLLIFICLFFIFNKNLTKRFLHANDIYSKSFYAKIVKHEPRFEIWNCSYNIVKTNHNFLVGNGFSQARKQLNNCFLESIEVEKRRDWFVKSNFNAHNQFIGVFLGSGAIGLAIFLILFYFLYTESKGDFYSLSLLCSLILMCCVESVFLRQIGEYIFSLIIIIILKRKSAINKNIIV